MVKKKTEGVTTYPRFKGKAYAVGVGIFSGNATLAMDYANALTQARAAGYGVFKNAYDEIKPVLMRNDVPSALWGLYKAFINELIHKVQRKRIASTDEVITKWERMGLNADILRQCAEAVVEVVTEQAPTPASKGA
jgi:hypothetical protein